MPQGKHRYWQLVDKGNSDLDCWEWQGEVDAGGYGLYRGDWAKTWIYNSTTGKGKRGVCPPCQQVIQTCGNKLCCNPRHLERASFLKHGPHNQAWEKFVPREVRKGHWA